MRVRNILFILYLLIVAAMLTWPGYEYLGNRTEPFILGLPFVFFWNISWIVLTFMALGLYHLSSRRG